MLLSSLASLVLDLSLIKVLLLSFQSLAGDVLEALAGDLLEALEAFTIDLLEELLVFGLGVPSFISWS